MKKAIATLFICLSIGITYAGVGNTSTKSAESICSLPISAESIKALLSNAHFSDLKEVAFVTYQVANDNTITVLDVQTTDTSLKGFITEQMSHLKVTEGCSYAQNQAYFLEIDFNQQ